jgi:hypothetical protein
MTVPPVRTLIGFKGGYRIQCFENHKDDDGATSGSTVERRRRPVGAHQCNCARELCLNEGFGSRSGPFTAAVDASVKAKKMMIVRVVPDPF